MREDQRETAQKLLDTDALADLEKDFVSGLLDRYLDSPLSYGQSTSLYRLEWTYLEEGG